MLRTEYLNDMPNQSLKYIRLQSGDALPSIDDFLPFKAIVVIEDSVAQTWQWDVSTWLVQSGCRYMMAWGAECSSWDDSVDWANLEIFDFQDIPDDRFVMTSWHENVELSEVFWDAKHASRHPVHEFANTVILHISKDEKQTYLENLFEHA